MRRLPAVLPFVLAAAVFTAGCGSNNSTSNSGTKPSSTTTSVGGSNTATGPNELIGEWSTTNVCEVELRAFQKAGLEEFVGEWVGGAEYPGQMPGSGDPCRGATPVQHSHRFGEGGSFASYDQNGQQVDEGTYQTVGDRTLTLGEPPIPVRYRIEGNTATFRVVIPGNCTTKRCRKSAAYVVSVFFPRVYERVK